MSRSRLGHSLLLAVVLLSLAAPIALADHSYSHRYIIYGRVVDAAGNAVPGLTVNVVTKDFRPEGACGSQPGTETEAFGKTQTLPVTNEYGEWSYCYHAHSLSRALPGTADVSIAGTNVTTKITLDPYFRQQFVPLQLPDVSPNANPAIYDTEYTVLARVWRAGEATVEGITVFGDTLNYKPVNVTITLPNGTQFLANTTTNSYGDFAVRVPTTFRVTEGTVTYSIEGENYTGAVDSKMGITAFKTELPKQSDPAVRIALITLGVIVVLGVAGGFAYTGYRRMSAKREAEKVRATSTRKRAQR